MAWPSGLRYGRFWEPFDDVQRLQKEMNRLFSGYSQTLSYDFPPINVWMSENDVIVTAELPGIDAGNMDISVVGDSLTLSGIRESDKLKEGESYHRQERSFGRFARTIKLPFQVATDKVDARYERGMLQVTLPRIEAEKPKKIAIKAQ